MNHYQEAERLLAEADKLWEGPRVGVARTLGTMASAHATLALVKATRQSTNDLEAERWAEGYQAAQLDSIPDGLTPEERLLFAISLRSGDNPYAVTDTPTGATS